MIVFIFDEGFFCEGITRLNGKKNGKKLLLRNCPSPNFSILSHPLVNPYPDWVGDSKSWGIFGTFSDYVIRKILLNLFPKKIKLNYILATNSRQILRNTIGDIRSYINTSLTKQLIDDYNSKDLWAFYDSTESYIKNYSDNSISWKDSLYEVLKRNFTSSTTMIFSSNSIVYIIRSTTNRTYLRFTSQD